MMTAQVETRVILGGTILILLLGLFSNFVLQNYAASSNEAVTGSWACTAELRVCPDGSTVGRIPPYCQFASCQ
jgi:hypothetical protein